MYQIQTHASVLTKEDFLSMLAELYEKSFLPSHFKSGFLKSGLHPLNRETIPSSKLAKSIPFTGKSASASADGLSGGQEKHSEKEGDCHSESQSGSNVGEGDKRPEVVINLRGIVTIKKESTPICLELRGYFARLLATKNKKSGNSIDKQKVKPSFYSEPLTTDEICQRLEQQEKEKEEKNKALAFNQKKGKMAKMIKLVSSGSKKAGKKVWNTTVRKSKKQAQKTSHAVGEITRSVAASSEASQEEDTGVCEECGAIYADDSEELPFLSKVFQSSLYIL